MPQRSWLPIGVALALVGCQASAPNIQNGNSSTGNVGQQTGALLSNVPHLVGTVQFPTARGTQALPSDVLAAASVTLIDPATNTAVSTGLTNSSGQFTLTFSGGFTASVGSTYVVEAFKGLGNNAPGYYAPRFRTIIQLTAGGWTSITGTTIVINALTTAIAIESNLDSVNVSAASTISKATGGSTLSSSLTNHSDTEVYQLSSDISNYLTNNVDALVNISGVQPAISSFSPSTGGTGTVVTLWGNGFNANPGSTTVTFANGVSAPVIYVAPNVGTSNTGKTVMAVTVPAGVVTGKISLATPIGTCSSGLSFNTSVPVVSSFSDTTVSSTSTGSIGDSLTITGSNFDSNLSNNVVKIGGQIANITSCNTTTIVTTIPQGASTGTAYLTVTTAAGTSNQYACTVFPTITSMSRNSGPVGASVTLNGGNFDAISANDQIRIGALLVPSANITSASGNQLVFTVPAGANTGPLTVQVGANKSVAQPFYVTPNVTGNVTQ